MRVHPRHLLGGFVLFASAAGAIPISVTGGADSLVASTKISPSNPANEAAWVSSLIGDNVVAGARTSDPSGWMGIQGTNAYALDTADGPAYFLIKTGAGHPDGHTHFLFRNDFDASHAVIDLAALGFDPDKADATKIGYYASYQPIAVPEPSSLVLLGTGLLGVGLMAWRRRSAATTRENACS